MAYLTVDGAIKRYGTTTALNGVSFSVAKGEFFTLLGPSGCGKTTLLRSIAGFSQLTDGRVDLAGHDLLSVPPHKRDIGMVFQDYAIFPHLTVAENVAFGLKARKVAAAEIRERVAEALATVRLTALAERLPAALSGGQQQRIGIARAMVVKPRLLLMDEPLSNLDAKLRLDLRDEIRAIQREIGIAAIYVTHDQEEALAISDRICVMDHGCVEQIGTPQQIYGQPETRFVASFVGTMNLLAPGAFGLAQVPGVAQWALRPERLRLAEAGARARDGAGGAENGAASIAGTVEHFSYLGREAHLTVQAQGHRLVAQIGAPPPDLAIEAGRQISLSFDPADLHAFDAQGRRVPAERAA
ncbi:putative sperimidine/putrescine transport protein [Bosea sp. LC85]|uniref:ABC transporter ATP-binding protein n=1 Tax=Bosea sp. LC85 TaxID=1502851 RepID=UPI0004E3B604|nr:ABC transporter ATP-binding protein [Bosea sp. LC85]KFC74840.1 putative sperimidine/putrescine transport protein [Bosea sp. LC85]